MMLQLIRHAARTLHANTVADLAQSNSSALVPCTSRHPMSRYYTEDSSDGPPKMILSDLALDHGHTYPRLSQTLLHPRLLRLDVLMALQ